MELRDRSMSLPRPKGLRSIGSYRSIVPCWYDTGNLFWRSEVLYTSCGPSDLPLHQEERKNDSAPHSVHSCNTSAALGVTQSSLMHASPLSSGEEPALLQPLLAITTREWCCYRLSSVDFQGEWLSVSNLASNLRCSSATGNSRLAGRCMSIWFSPQSGFPFLLPLQLVSSYPHVCC